MTVYGYRCGSECLAYQGYGHHVTCERFEMVPKSELDELKRHLVAHRDQNDPEVFCQCGSEECGSIAAPDDCSARHGFPARNDVAILAHHALVEIRCDHEAKTDVAVCNCALWASKPQPTVQAAKEAWAAHALEKLRRV